MQDLPEYIGPSVSIILLIDMSQFRVWLKSVRSTNRCWLKLKEADIAEQ